MNYIMFENQETTVSIGRNGSIKTAGVAVFECSNGVTIHPISSRKNIANGCITIPKSEIKRFIKRLEEVYEKI